VFFTVFMALFVIFLNVLWWNLPNVLQHITSSEIRILNTKKVGFVKAGFSMFSNFTAAKKLSYRFPWKTSSDRSKLFTTNLPNFTEFDRRKRKKIHCQFCFLCSCWRHKIWNLWFFFLLCVLMLTSSKTLTFSFERTQITWAFVLSARAIVTLQWATLKDV